MIKRAQQALRKVVQVYAPPLVKRLLWNRDFSRGRYGSFDSDVPAQDCMYVFLKKYANGGSILDCGCGAGNTQNKLDAGAYTNYLGIDVSDFAISKAEMRARANGRLETNSYVRADFFSYVPIQKFDVILFRDSIYYVARARIQGMLNRYANYLTDRGVFITRMYGGTDTYKPILDDIRRNFEIAEHEELRDQTNTAVIVFRRHCLGAGVDRSPVKSS